MKYTAKVIWIKPNDAPFTDNQFSRVHQWVLDGGCTIQMSSSPQVVPLPMSNESLPDPEETFIASVASCHMLFFLSIAARYKFIIHSYQDLTEGFMEKNDSGKMMITQINLYPTIEFAGERTPNTIQIQKIHDLAHQNCFLANSVKSSIHIYPK